MTIQEAIRWIQLDIGMMKFDPTTGEETYLNDDAKKVIEAQEMAIEALKSQLSNTSEIQNSSDDLISRQDAINYVDDIPYIKEHPNLGLIWKEWIEALPSVQSQQKTGRWIYDGEYKNGMMRMKCSNCKTVIETFDCQSRLRYCQNCGSKMEV